VGWLAEAWSKLLSSRRPDLFLTPKQYIRLLDDPSYASSFQLPFRTVKLNQVGWYCGRRVFIVVVGDLEA